MHFSIFTDLGNVEGLAVDWLANNLYWTDENLASISVARIGGTASPNYRRTLFSRVSGQVSFHNPRAIALAPRKG